MRNVLFIGPYRTLDGWGIASKNWLKALSMVDSINLAARPVYLSKQKYDKESIIEQEEISCGKYDVIIQNVLPDCFVKFYDSKNIGICYFETVGIDKTKWASSIKHIDELITSTAAEYRENQNKVRHHIPIPVDAQKYAQNFKEYITPVDKNSYKFYTIGENIYRKNLTQVIASYYAAFTKQDNVSLTIKSSMPGLSSQDAYNHINKLIHGIQQEFNKQWFPPIHIITSYLTDEEMCGLHKYCDCFMSLSRGESQCMPAVDAAGFGNYLILTDNTGMSDIITESANGLRVKSDKVPVICPMNHRPIPHIYTSQEYWMKPLMSDSIRCMRYAYENNIKNIDNTSIIDKMSYEQAAIKLGEICNR
jgi:glycosyltransferase involved in cell wall biosynthesis